MATPLRFPAFQLKWPLDLFGIQVSSHLSTKRVSFNIGPTRYLVENALVAEKLNVPPTSVNMASVDFQRKHITDIKLQDVNRAEINAILEIGRAHV